MRSPSPPARQHASAVRVGVSTERSNHRPCGPHCTDVRLTLRKLSATGAPSVDRIADVFLEPDALGVRSARQRQHREARLHRGRSSITQCAAAHVRRFMPPPNGGSAQRRCPWAYAVAWVDERSCRAVVVLLGSRAPSARTLEAAVQSARCARGNRPRQTARRHRMRANMPSADRRRRSGSPEDREERPLPFPARRVKRSVGDRQFASCGGYYSAQSSHTQQAGRWAARPSHCGRALCDAEHRAHAQPRRPGVEAHVERAHR